jgi:hypothetical protein
MAAINCKKALAKIIPPHNPSRGVPRSTTNAPVRISSVSTKERRGQRISTTASAHHAITNHALIRAVGSKHTALAIASQKAPLGWPLEIIVAS